MRVSKYIRQYNEQPKDIAWNYGFLAGVKQKQIVSTTTIDCGLRNPKFFELIIDFVTKSLMQMDHWVCQMDSNHIFGMILL